VRALVYPLSGSILEPERALPAGDRIVIRLTENAPRDAFDPAQLCVARGDRFAGGRASEMNAPRQLAAYAANSAYAAISAARPRST